MKLNLLTVCTTPALVATLLFVLTGCEDKIGATDHREGVPVRNLVVKPNHTGPHQDYTISGDPGDPVCFDPTRKSSASVSGDTLTIQIPVKPCVGPK